MAELTHDDTYLEPTVELSGDSGFAASASGGDVIICVHNCGPPPPQDVS